ncbi:MULTISPECIES: biotin transporter BioY [Clostridium]|jgi:biotin transport system substrate-specific component|uniref:Biotin transporter n=2 Tax=Clostridium TaxID=1485 RepID=A0A0D1BUY6_CLOBO|nr:MULTISPECIES: biotin transporter BioY [Clostridium]EKS4344938.1 biotin transporter BioY [Clostridium botulinum]MBE6075542.1 biotin transporter BioY [Clostridium lundense]EDU36505.1 outer membrane insertion signal domain protein [Clostridium sporogenes ATCC 15579]EKS4346131.1 biotin transporter BioY [Clostridium botulinum]EKS4395410.1 biotin transporter BioY [Clostridium botulinum]
MRQSKTLTMSRCALFTALVAISAYIQIPVPFMDYFTLQFFFVLLAGMILGEKQGAISVGLYVLMGLLGVPVFAAGGGIGYIFKPSFGYLLGFIMTAYAVGYTVKKINARTFRAYLLSAFMGFIITYAIGLTYKFLILNLYLKTPTSFMIIFLSCFPLDMPGDIFLCVISALFANKINPILRRERNE